MVKHYPHLLAKPFPPPSIGERRHLLNLLLRVMGEEQLSLAGRDDVIDRAHLGIRLAANS